MSQQSAASKPSLQGVRIKARKGAVKAQAKHEPTSIFPLLFYFISISISFSVFRDQLYKHLETVPEADFDSFATKLVQAGSTLEFLKYADALFEIILVGGLLQPGGSFIDDGAPTSPFTVFNAKDPAEVDDIKKYTEVLNKLIRRFNTSFSTYHRSNLLISPLDINIFKNLSRNLHFQLYSSTFTAGRPRRKTSYRLQSDS